MKRKNVSGYPSSSYSNSKVSLVCGDVARGLNFDVMTCMPCKAFFRKNAFKRPVSIIYTFKHSNFILLYSIENAL
jgi:hypothetical protein